MHVLEARFREERRGGVGAALHVGLAGGVGADARDPNQRFERVSEAREPGVDGGLEGVRARRRHDAGVTTPTRRWGASPPEERGRAPLGEARQALDVDRVTAFSDERWAQEIAMTSHDAAEGLASFAERRPPAFLGW